MIKYLIVFLLELFFLIAYLRIAVRFQVTDNPNERSSHSEVTIRGGGIVFPVAMLLWFFLFGLKEPWIVFATLLIAGISFIDDIQTITFKIRFVFQFIVVSILFWQLNIFGLTWYLIVPAYIVTVGWINSFNFMDGINGMTAIYGLITLISFLWVNSNAAIVPQSLIIVFILALIIFGFINVRKRAIAFAGDVGSITLAFILSWLMISLMYKTGHLEYILLFAVYGIDSGITILLRLWKKENIFSAHRSHLYQYLSNEFGWSHLQVAGIYGLIQLAINISTILLINHEIMTWSFFSAILITLGVIYFIIRQKITSSINDMNLSGLKF